MPGTAVFLTSNPGGAPPVLLHHLKHNKVLHEKVMLLSVLSEEIPQVEERDRVECRELGEGTLPGHRPVRIHGDSRHSLDPGALGRESSTKAVRFR